LLLPCCFARWSAVFLPRIGPWTVPRVLSFSALWSCSRLLVASLLLFIPVCVPRVPFFWVVHKTFISSYFFRALPVHVAEADSLTPCSPVYVLEASCLESHFFEFFSFGYYVLLLGACVSLIALREYARLPPWLAPSLFFFQRFPRCYSPPCLVSRRCSFADSLRQGAVYPASDDSPSR